MRRKGMATWAIWTIFAIVVLLGFFIVFGIIEQKAQEAALQNVEIGEPVNAAPSDDCIYRGMFSSAMKITAAVLHS